MVPLHNTIFQVFINSKVVCQLIHLFFQCDLTTFMNKRENSVIV